MFGLRRRGGNADAPVRYGRRRRGRGDGTGEPTGADGQYAAMSDVRGTRQHHRGRLRELPGERSYLGDDDPGDPGATRHRGRDEDPPFGYGARRREGGPIG